MISEVRPPRCDQALSSSVRIGNNSSHSLSRGVRSLSRWLSKSHKKRGNSSTTNYNENCITDLEKSLGSKDTSTDSTLGSSVESTVSLEKTTKEKLLSNDTPKVSNSIRVNSIRGKLHSSIIQLLDESWEDWQDGYQKGIYNLSDVGRPTCFNGFGHMTAPLHRNETNRIRAVAKLMNNEVWRELKPWLNVRLRELLRRYRIKSATVSLLDQTTQNIMFEVGLGYLFDSLGRELSIDAHTILSTNYFALLDASSDWRTRLNPLVYGPPFIKFYLGIPIVYKNVPVGCLAILDPYLKTRVSPELVIELKQISEELVNKLEKSLEENKSSWSASNTNKWSNVSLNDFPSQEPYIDEYRETLALNSQQSSVKFKRDGNDSDNSSYVSDLSSQSFSIHSLSQESLIMPFSAHRARLHQISSCKTVLQPYEVFESLLRCPSIQQVIKKACRMVMQNLGANAVYIAEVRTQQKARIDDCKNISYNGMAVCDIEKMSPVRKLANKEVVARLAGSCKPNTADIDINDVMVQRDLPLLQAAIPSRYGLKFSFEDESSDGETGCNGNFISGIMVPLRRSVPKFKQIGSLGEIQSGGFLLNALSVKNRDFSPGDCAFMKKVAQALENILTCYDEIQPS